MSRIFPRSTPLINVDRHGTNLCDQEDNSSREQIDLMLNGDCTRSFVAMLVVFAGLVASLGLASAQSTSASVSGRITDSSGAALPGVEVTLKNVDTESSQRTTSNGEGFYSFPTVAPGNYLMNVHKQSFRSVSVTGITLDLQDKLSRNFVLPVGSISESITVTADSINVNTTDATVSTVIDQTYVQNMPLNGRSFQDLILLTPGVVTTSPQTPNAVGYAGEFSVNGQRSDANYYTVDGVSANTGMANDTFGASLSQPGSSGSLSASTALGTTQALVSVDDLQELRVQTSTFSAQYGRNPGGEIAFETKSGTNQWHGTGYEFLRNTAFDANDWFNDYFSLPQPPLRQNDFGGTLGGPVRIPHVYNGKDKTFFFVSYEGLRLEQPQEASNLFVPDNCMRGVAGACASLNAANPGLNRAPAYAPLLPVVNTFPAPVLEIDPVNGIGEFRGSWSLPASINATSVRIDQEVTNKMNLFSRFSDTNSNAQSRSGQSPQELSETPFLTRTYTAGANNIFSSQVSNELRFNYSSNQVTPENVLTAFDGGMPINLVSYLGLGTYPAAGPSILLVLNNNSMGVQQGHGLNRQEQWNVVDTLSYKLGAHQLRFGIDYRRLTPFVEPVSPGVNYSFYAESSVESGAYDSGQIMVENPAYPKYTNFAAFAQDDWKLTPHLSISFGLRWEVNPPPSASQGPSPYTIALNGSNSPNDWALAPEGTPLWHTTRFNFAPRLGAAYILRDRDGWETVLRGGGGVFFDTGQQDGSIGFQGPGFVANNFLPNGTPGATFESAASCTSTPSGTNCPAGLVPQVTGPSGFDTNQQLTQIYGFSPHLQLPYTLQWNLSVQQALGKSQALTVSYVGSHGSRLLEQNFFQPVSNPNPNIVNMFLVQNGLTSDYHSLQAQFQRRLSRGLTVLGSYTWSHCIDYGSLNFEIGYLRGNCDFDVRNNLSAAFSYTLPSVGHNGFAKAILDHWGLDDRLTARTSFPIFLQGNTIFDTTTLKAQPSYYYSVLGQPLYLSGNTCNAFFAPLFQAQGTPDQCPGGRAINPCAFVQINQGGGYSQLPLAQLLCTPPSSSDIGGVAPRNQLRGFDAVEMDLAVRREFPIREKLRLQFRAEAFNLFNHPNFGQVGTRGFGFGLVGNTLATALGAEASQYQMGGPRSMQLALKLVF
jgi:hypothetical protein